MMWLAAFLCKQQKRHKSSLIFNEPVLLLKDDETNTGSQEI